MADDLAELKERLAFVEAEIRTVDREASAFERDNISITAESGIEKLVTIYAEQRRAIPVSLVARAGTVVNEMRSCLDELAGRLAIRNGAVDTTDVYFTISKSQAIFETDGLSKKLRKLSRDDQDVISNLKPFKDGHKHLFALHVLDLKRKHNRLMGCYSGSQGLNFCDNKLLIRGNVVMENCSINDFSVDYLQYKQSMIRQLNHRVPIAYARGVDAPFDTLVKISYREPEEIAGQPVVELLDDFLVSVSEIVDAFS